MKVLIIEDEQLVAHQLRTILENINIQVLGIATDYPSSIVLLDENPCLCLVDIRLSNNDNGIEIGKVLNSKKIPFIYITANNELKTIKEAAKTQPIGYITKPFSVRDIVAAVELQRYKFNISKTVELKTNKGTIDVLISDILFLEADNVYTKIVTRDKTYLERTSLKIMLSKLDSNFQRVHRSYIINSSKVTAKKPSSLLIENYEIPISRSYLDKL